MPVLTKLTSDQVNALKTRQEKADNLGPYMEFISGLNVGDWASLTPDADENKRTVKRRLTVAARLSGYKVRYHLSSSTPDEIRFQLRSDNGTQSAVA